MKVKDYQCLFTNITILKSEYFVCSVSGSLSVELTMITVLAGILIPLITVSSLHVLVVPQMVGYLRKVSFIICWVNTSLDRKFLVATLSSPSIARNISPAILYRR